MGAQAILHRSESYEELGCSSCGMVFFVPTAWLSARRDRGDFRGAFHCPNGHSLVFRESELDRVRKQLAAQEKALAATKAELAFADRRAGAEEAKRKRLEKRARAGVCPCCKRTVRQLAAHMTTKHPEFAKDSRP